MSQKKEIILGFFFSHLNVCLHQKIHAKYKLQYMKNRHFMVKLVIISIYFDFSIMAQWLSEKSEDFIDDSCFVFFFNGIFLLMHIVVFYFVPVQRTVDNIHNNIHFAFFCFVSITLHAWCVMKENTLQLHKRS